MKKLKLSQGFTLIELIAVMVIISIIAGLLVGAGGAARRKAKEAKAKSMIASLEIAIGMYHDDTGNYPAGGFGGGCEGVYRHLIATVYKPDGDGEINPPEIDGWNGPYMKFNSDDLEPRQMPVGTATTIVDPWKVMSPSGTVVIKGEYRYAVGAAWGNTTSYNLWSCGPDGIDDSGDGNADYGDDIYNW